MLVLAVDTSTAATSVAIVGPTIRVGSQVLDGRRHAETIEPLLRNVLAESGVSPADIDCVACGVGPGPFTGLRVGIAAALAFGFARDIPVVGVCSLDVTARGASESRGEPVTVLTRARRSELCWATYDAAGRRLAGPVIRREPVEITGPCVGDAGPIDVVRYPSAIDLAELVIERLAAGEALPEEVYLPEEEAGDPGAATADVLERRIAEGRFLLPPRPVYLRRPDAVAPSLAGGSIAESAGGSS